MEDFRSAKKMNLEEVGRYFENKGYKVEKLEQKWRHVTGMVRFENEKLFLKMASTEDIGKRTINEKYWNENVNTVWKKYIRAFKSPKNFDEGEYGGKYWFVTEKVFGKPLVEVKKGTQNIDEKDLVKAAEIAKNILDLADICLLPKDQDHLKEVWKVRFRQKFPELSKDIKSDTKALLQFIEDKQDDLEIGVSHGDFVPWHIMKTKKNEYYLIDGEAAQIGGLKFYDVAYFYHRVYTKLARPDLAESFLNIFKKISGWTEKNTKEFLPVLATRIIGGYFDAERDGVTSIKLNRELEKKLFS